MYDNNRIIAIGDIHGDYDVFIELLKIAKIIDSKLNWVGKDTYVIQMGDTLDGKRPDVKLDKEYSNITGEIEIIKLILSLDEKAKKHGGRVISMLGNHELYPYYYNNDESFNMKYVKNVDLDNYNKLYNISRFKYFTPGSGKGAKIFGETRPLLLQLGKFIFCHGSLNEKFLKLCIKHQLNKPNTKYVDISKINKLVSNWLTGKSKRVPFFINGADDINPLFNRVLSDAKKMNEKECTNIVGSILKYFKNGKYLVMGHSTHKNINTLCNNQVYRTDIAISRAFGGTIKDKRKKLQVLEILQKNNNIKTNIITSKSKINIF